MLKGVLPRVLPNGVNCFYIVFEGKQDLEKQLVRKMRGWQLPETAFLVIRDQDSADCMDVKKHLIDLCREAGRPNALVRIACRELESFYFGDLSAVEAGLGVKNVVELQRKAKYRVPDSIENPFDKLQKLTDGTYQNVSGSRIIGALLSLDNNTSHSFNVLVSGIRKLFATA